MRAAPWHSLAMSCLIWAVASSTQAQCSPIGDPYAQQSDARPWRGSAFTFSQTLGASTLSKSSTLSYDPLYAWTFDLCAQWYFRNTLKASIEQTLDLELTDSNATTHRREPVFGDTSVRVDARLLTYRFGPKRYAGWNAGAELLAPTSPASRAASTVASARVRTGAKLVTDQVLTGALGVLEFSYLRRFSEGTTTLAESPYPCLAGTFASVDCTHLPSMANVSDSMAAKLQLYVEFTPSVWLDLVGALQWNRAHSLADATFVTAGGDSVTLPDQSRTHFRNSRTLLIGVLYEPASFVALELAATSRFSERNPDGSLRGPLHVSDLSLGIDAWFDIERLYALAD
jgi:hypothetical protein